MITHSTGACFERSPFPRPGWALCPSILAPYLQDWIPCEVSCLNGYKPSYLCDLDASFWSCAGPAEAETCILAMEDSLARQGYRLLGELGHLKLEALGHPNIEAPIVVSDETATILEVAGFDKPGVLRELSIERLLWIPGFSPRRFVDLMVGIEAWGMSSDEGAIQRLSVGSMARRCLELLGDVDINQVARDVRIGEYLRELPKASSLFGSPASALDRAANRAGAIKLECVPRCCEAFAAILSVLEHCYGCTLQEELIEVASAVTKRGKGLEAVVIRLGLDGHPPLTLEVAGERLGITRERVRQIVAKARQNATGRVIIAPALNRAASTVAESVPLSETACNDAWRCEGVLRDHFSLASLVSAAGFVGRELDFAVDESGSEPYAVPLEWVGQEGDSGILSDVRHEAIRLSNRYGAVQFDELAARVASSLGLELALDATREAVAGMSDAVWLDENQQWLWLDGRSLKRNRIVNRIAKAMSVAERLELSDLRSALRRDPRMGGFTLPSAVLAAVCRRIGWLRVEGTWVQSIDAPDYRECLSGVELTVVSILDEFGPVMRVQDVWPVAQAEGIQHVRFWQVVAGSPALTRYARSVYGLRGRPISASDLYEMVEETPAGWTRLLEEQGRLPDARFWLRYRISANAMRIGVLTLPASFRHELEGDVELCDPDGERIATVRFEHSRISGLTRAFRALGAEEDDHIALLVNPEAMSSVVVIGDSESVSEFLESVSD